ncbi:hypothetical protein M0802_000077 [Mischocyttarus mexicanus]|nr:hypothetical protein M0802_000077 [Mischocyttarus mexicanus]
MQWEQTEYLFPRGNNVLSSDKIGWIVDSKNNYDNVQNIDPKWQISLISENCMIKKHNQGWQICPKIMNKNQEDMINIVEEKKSAAICCNRNNINDLLEEENKENESDHGSILLKECLKLLTTSEAKINFILKILTKALNERKIFVISGIFPVARKPLNKRGWIEKKAIRKMISLACITNEVKLDQIEKLLRQPANFIWYTNKKAFAIRTDDKTIVNKFSGCYFTSKVDMCNNLENVSWFYEAGSIQIEEFKRDFYITACTGILKWFSFLTSIVGPNSAWSPDGTIPINAILFALERCVEYLRDDYKDAPIAAWNQFLDWYGSVINHHAILKTNDGVDINELLTLTDNILREMSKCHPQSRVDGMRNIWILKPGDKSLGKGIVLKNSLNDILHKVNQAAKEGMQYVVQKYIERPLLVHKTKIDVRQWFLITSTQPLIVWMYKDILIRFASRNFTLDDFHESIHLCNTTVQLKYRKSPRTNLQLPNEFHWNLQNFKDYLRSRNEETAWEKIIRPGIKQNLIGVLLASQEYMVNRKNSFQLYGADFVIMDDFSVWLIEINNNPRLHPPSSSVTAKLYPEVIEDTIKVSEPGATNKRNEPKKSAISQKSDLQSQGFYKTKLVQVKQQRKQFEQQILKSVIRPTTNLIQSPIILNKSTDKVRRPTSTRTFLNFNHNNEEKKVDKPSILSKTTRNYYQTIANTDILQDSNEEVVNNFILPKDNFSYEESHSIIINANTSEKVEFESKSFIEPKTIEMEEEISVNNSRMDNNGNKATYFAIQRRVEEAIKNKKIFLIRGDIPYLENTLKKRGWIKKYESRKSRHLPYGSATIMDPPSIGNINLPDGSLNEDYVIFSVLKHISPDFIWDCRNDFVEWTGHIKPDTLLNRFEKSFIYTSKLGMATILENVHWHTEDDVACVQYPRSYNVARDKTAFTDDYRQTAAVSFLKWFIDQIEQGVDLSNKGSSPISPKQIEFAIKRCEEFVAMKNDEYLDMEEVLVSSTEWDKFIDDYVMAVHRGNGIIDEESEQFDSERSSLIILYNLALEILKKVKDIDPQYELNGTRNIWILKPSNYCCGVGIAMSHKLNYIIKRVQDCARDYFIVQKYIEKPLLVKDTKFDIRQWYLVTSSYPLTIWIYNSRPFSFDSYHEAIHICNTAVQNKYIIPKNSIRSLDWDCDKLNEYLKTIGYTGEPWYEKIYPKICQAIIATMLAAQEHMDKRRYSFELYGADFVIMNDLSVWLIEINTNPRMHPPGTRITQRLYPNVLESLIKVIMDYPFNPNADTGDFVLAYKQMTTDIQSNTGLCLTALGKSILPKSKSLQHTNWQYL